MNKLWQIYAWGTVLITFVFLLIVGYWQFYPYKTVVFNDKVFPVVTKEVKRGENLVYLSKACKYSNVIVEISRSFVDDLVYDMPITTSNRELGCSTSVVNIFVPQSLPVGTYYLRSRYYYQVNPIRTIVINQDTEVFKVIN